MEKQKKKFTEGQAAPPFTFRGALPLVNKLFI
jgi:hypothetical protein